jgi:prolipoprotein diacylglyceryltransferase
MLPILQLGPLAVQAPGLVLLLGLWVGLALAERQARRLGRAASDPAGPAPGLTPDTVYNLALVGVLSGLVAARLAYALRFAAAYRADPLGLLALTPATLAPIEGVLVGGLAMLVYGARRRLPLGPTLDGLAPALAVLGLALALAHLASGDAFGAPTAVPWRIYLWDDYRHPTQVYEVLAACLILGVWWWQSRLSRRAALAGTGRLFIWVVLLSALSRLLIEAFRGDSALTVGGLRVAQLWAWLILAASLYALSRLPAPASEADTPDVAPQSPFP